MRALIVHRNEQPLCIIGAPNAVMFSVHVDLGIAGPEMATMDALGMNDLGGERQPDPALVSRTSDCW